MKKNGFTLAEVLIALGIVGVCAALITPAVVNIMPDRNKVRVLQYYSYITNSTLDLLNDPDIYYQELKYVKEKLPENDEEGNPQYVYLPEVNSDGSYKKNCNGGLDCTQKSQGRFCKDKEGSTKYPYCLYDKLGMTYSESGASTFKDGSKWTIKPGSTYEISIEIPASRGCGEFGVNGCKNANKFRFSVDNWGNVKPLDRLSKVYLKNPTRTNAQKDKNEA